MTRFKKIKTGRKEIILRENKNSNNISSSSSKKSIATEIKIIKKNELCTGTGTKYKASTITKIKQIRSLPIQNKNIANNEHFADLSDSTSESINTSNKKLGIGHIKTKVINSNNSHRNERNNNTIQNGNYTGKNYKSWKDQYSEIQRNNNNQKYYNHSKTRSEGTISNIPKNKSQYKNHQSQNNKYEQIKNTIVDQNKKVHGTKNIQQNNDTNKTSTTQHNNQGTRQNNSQTKSQYPNRSTTTKIDSHIVRQTNKKTDKNYKNKISASSKNTNSLLQNNDNKNNDIQSNTAPPNNNCKIIPTANTKRKRITNTTILNNNDVYNNIKNDNISASRNNNNNNEDSITNPRSDKETNCEKKKLLDKNIGDNKEQKSNDYTTKSNNKTNKQHKKINIGRDKNIQHPTQNNTRHAEKDDKNIKQSKKM